MVPNEAFDPVEPGSACSPILFWYDRVWRYVHHSPQLRAAFLINLSTGAMMNGLQTLPQWRNYFSNPSASILGAINAIYPVGKLLGLFPSTWISDRYGRKMPMLFGFFLLLIGTVLQGAAQNIGMMIVSRFILGFGTAFLAQPSPILVTELAYPTQRGKITSLYNTFYVSLFRLLSMCFTYIWVVLRCRPCRLVDVRYV